MSNTDKLVAIKNELSANANILKGIHLHIKAISKQSEIEQKINKCIKSLIKVNTFQHIDHLETEDELSYVWNSLHDYILIDLFKVYMEKYDLIPTEIKVELDKLTMRSSICFDNAFLIASREYMFSCEMPNWKLTLVGMPIVICNTDNDKTHAVSFKNYIDKGEYSFKHLHDYAFDIMHQLSK